MPYREPSKPDDIEEARPELDAAFWRVENGPFEGRAISFVDDAFVKDIGALAKKWLSDTQRKYPEAWEFVPHEFSRALHWSSEYLKLTPKGKKVVAILVALLETERVVPNLGDLVITPKDWSTKVKEDILKESLSRWYSQLPHILRIVYQAFKNAAPLLLRDPLASYPEGVPLPEVMEVVYFRGFFQRDFALYHPKELGQAIYKSFYE